MKEKKLFNKTKEQTFQQINEWREQHGGKPLDLAVLNQQNHTAALIIENFATILHKFQYNYIGVVQDRVKYGYSHIEVKQPHAREYIYVSSAYRSMMKDDKVRHFLMFRKELIDIWMGGKTLTPSIISFINGNKYVYLSSTEFRDCIVKSYNENKEDGLLFYQDSKASKWVLIEVPEDKISQRFEEFPSEYAFDTTYLPKFMKIPKVVYTNHKLGHSGVVKIGYYGAGIKWQEFTFKSFGEAEEFVNHQGIKVSYRTLMRYAKADKLYRLGPNKNEYDYLYIIAGDKELPDETPTIVKENPHREVVVQATEDELPEVEAFSIDANPDTEEVVNADPDVAFEESPDGETIETVIGNREVESLEREHIAIDNAFAFGYYNDQLAKIRAQNMANFCSHSKT